MDQHQQRGRSPSAGQQQAHISQSHSPSPNSYPPNEPSVGLDLEVNSQQQQFSGAGPNDFDNFNPNSDFLAQQQQQQHFARGNVSDPVIFDPNHSFDQNSSVGGSDPSLAYNNQSQPYLSPNLNDGDFSLFPPSGGQGDQFNAPLFEQGTLNPSDINNMASPQTQHSSPSPHLQPGSAHQSPSFNQHQFSSPPGNHSRNTSLGPEAALLPNQMGEWNQPQFQGHRRTPSEYSDVSSVTHSPNLVTSDSFDVDHSGHSPLQRASDGSLYQEVLGIGSFSISDAQGNTSDPRARSPSHSPAISPRILPQQMPEIGQQPFGMVSQNTSYPQPGYPNMQGAGESFPTLQNTTGADMSQMVPPAINIDFAPNNAKPIIMEGGKPYMDQDSLTPPDRGRPKSRPRAVTDPFHPGGGLAGRPDNAGSLSPALGAHLSPRSAGSRSLSPLDRDSAPGRRRQSTSSVPNNIIALRLADPEYQNSQESGASKRIQKHPATFQCTLCPKRFTRAYNLRSHLRTHTDERPFVCTVCGKAFARQHDRKRHESLHSGEKKFVCKGDLKAGGQWGCGRRFARADALGRHFRSEAGRVCIKPLLDEEMMERQRAWNEQQMQQNMAQNMAGAPGAMAMDPNAGFGMDNNMGLPAALLAQYPALAQMNWSAPEMAGGMDDELSGRSSFEASDYDEGDESGYMSGPGTGFGEGGMNQNFGDIGYASDYGGR